VRHIKQYLSYDLRLNLAFSILIAALFIVFNPFYALFFSSVINIFFKKIDHKLFLFVFALSFALMFTNRDPGTGGDVIFYIERYSKNLGIFTIPLTAEPVWTIYRKTLFFVFGGDVDLFVIFNYFLQFSLLAILSRLINRENYIIVLFVLIFFNLALLYNIYHVWRHLFAILFFFVGAYSMRARVMIYLSPLIHIVALPLAILVSKINFRVIFTLIFVVYIMTPHVFSRISSYENVGSEFLFNTYYLISAMIILILKYFQILKLNQVENRIFYALIFFICAPYFFPISGAFSVLYGRTASIFMFFNSILIAKFIIRHSVICTVFTFVFFIYRIFFSFNNPDILHTLKNLGDGRVMDIFNGIYLLTSNYDSNRWSDYISAL
jgi:hypothetical protein